jgi:hypothetical protein
MTKKEIKQRLKYLKQEIEAERISYGEVAELQSLKEYIPDDDILLKEWAGIPEFEEEEPKTLEEIIADIASDYEVELIKITTNIQGTHDIELSHNIYYKEQEKMENRIMALGNINDIYYLDVA